MRIRRARQIAAAGIVGIAMVATPVITNTGPVAAETSKPTCQQVRDDAWPKWVQGLPDGIDPHTTAATYMWVTTVTVPHPGDAPHRQPQDLQRSADDDRDLQGASAVRLEKGDLFEVRRTSTASRSCSRTTAGSTA